jgi:hypothetical protein
MDVLWAKERGDEFLASFYNVFDLDLRRVLSLHNFMIRKLFKVEESDARIHDKLYSGFDEGVIRRG